MALVDCTVIVQPNDVVVSAAAATSVQVSSVVNEVRVQGAAGIRGPKGETGPQGPQGLTGPQGVSVVPYVSDTPPDPAEHPLWLHSTDCTLYFDYTDADSEQWVSIAGAVGPQGRQGDPGPAFASLDGGFAGSTYGGITSIDCGGAA